MILLDGKKLSDEIKEELGVKIQKLIDAGKKVPGLVTILVGDNPASQSYVKSKGIACQKLGMVSKTELLPDTISQEELLAIIDRYNKDDTFHGILVQLPLPKHIDEDIIVESILPSKDVDGFHPVSVGKLTIGKDTFYPCTPYGIVEMLKRYKIETSGKHAVVVGRSNIVGKPIANMLVQKKEGANCVVTVCHSAAKDLSKFTLQADILIAAIGRPDYITADMVKEGTVVIDVGINRVEDKTKEKGYRIVGDVDFENVAPKTLYITPVPGGVGKMTIAMLMVNTYEAYLKIEK